MSSIDQAFVKAFARRNQTYRRAAETAADASRMEDEGMLEIDHSVVETTELWIDSDDDKVIRADAERSSVVPRPHLTPAASPPKPNVPGEHTTQGLADGTRAESSVADALSGTDGFPTKQPANDPQEPMKDIESIEIQTTGAQANLNTSPDSLQQLYTAYVGVSGPLDLGSFAIDAVPPSEPVQDLSAAVPQDLPTFKAVWEVDSFEIPRTVSELFDDNALLEQLAERMTAAIGTGLRTVLVTSARSGEGRSSVAMGLALAAAGRGNRVALLDADVTQPTLADDLRLDVQYGWVDALRGGLPVEEVSVHAIKDQLTLIPLMTPHAATAATDQEIESVILRLRKSFDLIVIDGGVSGIGGTDWSTRAIETALIVRDRSRTDADEIYRLSYRLREAGVRGIGLVENFA